MPLIRKRRECYKDKLGCIAAKLRHSLQILIRKTKLIQRVDGRLESHLSKRKYGSGHFAPYILAVLSNNEDSLGLYLRIEYISRYEVAHAETQGVRRKNRDVTTGTDDVSWTTRDRCGGEPGVDLHRTTERK